MLTESKETKDAKLNYRDETGSDDDEVKNAVGDAKLEKPVFAVQLLSWRGTNGTDGKPHVKFLLSVTKGARTYEIERRYRQFEQLHEQFAPLHFNELLPEFPPKKYLGAASVEFINKRLELLQAWINQVTLLPRLFKTHAFLDFIKLDDPLPELPARMNAVYFEQYAKNKDDIENILKLGDRPMPEIDDNGVLIKVIAASINPVDWKMALGNMELVMRKPPHIPGFDIAGVVVRVGPSVTRFKVGDSVYGMAHWRSLGAYAEYVGLPEPHVAMKPKGLTFVEAASLPLVGLTSFQALTGSSQWSHGLRVLILGGSGGCGVLGIQLAKAMGAAYVACTCSARNMALCQSLGADKTIDYTLKWWEQIDDEKFDVVYDTVGGEDTWQHARPILKPKTGRFVTIAGDKQTKMNPQKLIGTGLSIGNRKFWGLLGYGQYEYPTCDSSKGGVQLDIISSFVDQGLLKPVVEKTFAMNKVADMYMHSIQGHTRGKVCLVIDPQRANEK